MASAPGRPRKKLAFKITIIALAAIIGWVLYDLYAPRTAHLREFDGAKKQTTYEFVSQRLSHSKDWQRFSIGHLNAE